MTRPDHDGDAPIIPPGELVTARALRIARTGYAARLLSVPPTTLEEHRRRLRVALVAASPVIVGDVLARWVSYLDDCTIREIVAAWRVGEHAEAYHDHKGAVRAFEYAATVLDDHAIVCSGGVPPRTEDQP